MIRGRLAKIGGFEIGDWPVNYRRGFTAESVWWMVFISDGCRVAASELAPEIAPFECRHRSVEIAAVMLEK